MLSIVGAFFYRKISIFLHFSKFFFCNPIYYYISIRSIVDMHMYICVFLSALDTVGSITIDIEKIDHLGYFLYTFIFKFDGVATPKNWFDLPAIKVKETSISGNPSNPLVKNNFWLYSCLSTVVLYSGFLLWCGTI